MAEAPAKNAPAQYSFDDDGKIAVTYTVASIIVVTEDRIRWRFMKHLQDVGARGGWIAPAGILFSLVLALVTSTFKDALGVAAQTWHAVFLLSAFLVGVWLLLAIIRAWRSSVGVEELIGLLKSDTAEAKGATAPRPDNKTGRPS